MNSQEEKILKEIIKYAIENHRMPTMRYLQNRLCFKSVNSITMYIKSLEHQNYLTRNNEGKLILNNGSEKYNDNLKTIKIINANNKFVQVILNKNKKYVAYQMHNNFFESIGIFKEDTLIVENKKELKNNDLGLFIIDNKYRIMKYNYEDGFYLLKDNEEVILHKVKIIGKVILIERKL